MRRATRKQVAARLIALAFALGGCRDGREVPAPMPATRPAVAPPASVPAPVGPAIPFVEDTRPAAVRALEKATAPGAAPLSKAEIRALAKKAKTEAAEKQREGEGNRLRYAATIQSNFYDNGLNITVRTSGPDATVLRLTFVLFDEVFIHNFEKGPTFDEAKKLGFRKAILYDGYTKNWTWTF